MYYSQNQNARPVWRYSVVTMTLLTILVGSALPDVVQASPSTSDSLPQQAATTSANTGASVSPPPADEMSTMVARLQQQIIDQQSLLQALQQRLAERSKQAALGDSQSAPGASSVEATTAITSPSATSEPVKTPPSSGHPSQASASDGGSSDAVAAEVPPPSQNSAPVSQENTVGSAGGMSPALPQPVKSTHMSPAASSTPVKMPLSSDHPSQASASWGGSSGVGAAEVSPPTKDSAPALQENTADSAGGVPPALPQVVKPAQMPPAATPESTQSTVPAAGENMTLSTEAQRQAYASGVTVWREIENSIASQNALGIILDEQYVMAGLQDMASHRALKMTPEEMSRTMDNLNSDYIRRANEARIHHEAEGKAYRIAFSKQKGVFRDAGALFRIDDHGRGHRLLTSDTAELEVTGKLPDGSVFDASGQHGQTRTVKVGSLLPSVAIGLQKVAPGGHLLVVVPPGKGYGDAGLPPSIPGGATLIFDITVKSVNETSDKPVATLHR